MAHWKSLFTSSKYITAADLYDFNSDSFRDLVATISKVVPLTIVGDKGKTDGRPGVYFKESKSGKPLGINATNASAISNVAGSTDWKDWVGTRITIRVEMVDVRGKGRMPAIRIVPFRPDQQTAASTTTKVPAGYQPGDELIAPPVDDEQAELARHAAEQERKS